MAFLSQVAIHPAHGVRIIEVEITASEKIQYLLVLDISPRRLLGDFLDFHWSYVGGILARVWIPAGGTGYLLRREWLALGVPGQQPAEAGREVIE